MKLYFAKGWYYIDYTDDYAFNINNRLPIVCSVARIGKTEAAFINTASVRNALINNPIYSDPIFSFQLK